MKSASRPVLTAMIIAAALMIILSVIRYAMARAGFHTVLSTLLAPTAAVWPFGQRLDSLSVLAYLVSLLLVLAVVALVVWLSARRSPTHFWPTVFSGWLATVVGGWLAGGVTGMRYLLYYSGHSAEPEVLAGQLMSQATGGLLWGLAFGWLVGLGAGLVAGRQAPPQPSYPPQPPFRPQPPMPR